MDVAFATGSGGQVVFEIGVIRSGLPQLLDGRGSERCATEVGVEDHAGGVDGGTKGRGKFGFDSRQDSLLDTIRGTCGFFAEVSGDNLAAHLGQEFANGGDCITSFDSIAESGDPGSEQEFIDGGQTAEKSGLVRGRSRLGGNGHGAISSQAASSRNWDGDCLVGASGPWYSGVAQWRGLRCGYGAAVPG